MLPHLCTFPLLSSCILASIHRRWPLALLYSMSRVCSYCTQWSLPKTVHNKSSPWQLETFKTKHRTKHRKDHLMTEIKQWIRWLLLIMEVLNKNLNKADAWLDTWDGCRSTDRDMGREPKPEISPLPLAPPPSPGRRVAHCRLSAVLRSFLTFKAVQLLFKQAEEIFQQEISLHSMHYCLLTYVKSHQRVEGTKT